MTNTCCVCTSLVELMKTSFAVELPLQSILPTFPPAVVLLATEEHVTCVAATSYNLLSSVR